MYLARLLRRQSEDKVRERIQQQVGYSCPWLAELLVEEDNPAADQQHFEVVETEIRFAAGEETLGSTRTNLPIDK